MNQVSSSLVVALCVFCWIGNFYCQTVQLLGQKPFAAYVSHGATPGPIYQFFASTTGDQGDAIPLSFAVTTVDAANPALFQIHSSSGILSSTAPFSSNGPVTYSLVVQVTATTSSKVSSASENITVNVLPQYETTPVFEHGLYVASLSENQLANTVVTVTRAFSLASVSNKVYAIVEGNIDAAFCIDSSTGVIMTTKSLDREAVSFYALTVRYIDDVDSVDVVVEVNVDDINDNAPTFSLALYQFSVDETLPMSSLVGSVFAYDPDFGTNGDFDYSLGDYSSVFSINPTGDISTQKLLDYEQQILYQVTMFAIDQGSPGLTSTTTILISVSNIDDECPIFSSPVYTAENMSSLPLTEAFLTVMAYDPDNFASVQYALVSGNEEGFFSLNSETGDIMLKANGDTVKGEHVLAVTASDLLCINKSMVTVEIGIDNVNDHSPILVSSTCQAMLEENPPLDTLVTTIKATDADFGLNGVVEFSIIENVGDSNLFRINSTTGKVYTTASNTAYNRELVSSFLLGISATDGGSRQDFCQLDILLLDVNDNNPLFEVSAYFVDLERTTSVGTYVVQVQALDPDYGSNGEVVYSLSTPPECPFTIHPSVGDITLNGTITEGAALCSLWVTATDHGSPSLSASVPVNITFTESVIPMFEVKDYTVSIAENYSSIPETVLQVTATGNATDYLYSIQHGSEYRSNKDCTFDIAPTSGFIYVSSTGLLDYEKLQPGPYSFRLLVHATSSSGGTSALAVVTVDITDINDVIPTFPFQTVTFSIPEEQQIELVGIVQAIDDDSENNSKIIYEIVDSGVFNINSSGMISTSMIFDAENPNGMEFTFHVHAYNEERKEFRGVTTVNVMISDINDNGPLLHIAQLNISLNESHMVNSEIMTIEASDPDSSDNLMFSILQGNEEATFQIVFVDNNAVLILNRTLDYEAIKVYHLVIKVSDGLHIDTATISIHVLDVDDELPAFLNSNYFTQIPENSAVGTFVMKLNVTNVFLLELKGLAEGRFNVSETGVISVSGALDREKFTDGQIVFPAFAYGGLLASAEITINLTDVNDFKPQFAESSFFGSIPENTLPGDGGLFVVQVKAFDLDLGQNGTIEYTLESGGNQGFLIDSITGIITAHHLYDREETYFFHLTVRATDRGAPTRLYSTADVLVEISDHNDNPPYWKYPYMFARVFENSTGMLVIQIQASDLDSGVNGSVTFSLESGNEQDKFSLIATTGELRVVGSLDYEDIQDRHHFLNFSVKDIGDPPLGSDTIGELEIYVLNGNDHYPVLDSNNADILLELSEDTKPGTQIHNYTASDLDQESDECIVFSIISGNIDNAFEIIATGRRSAILSTYTSLDFEQMRNYSLEISITDSGYPPLSIFSKITIVITNTNDESPQFNASSFHVAIMENVLPTSSILQLTADDLDSDDIAGGNIAYYQILSGNNKQRFDLVNGSLNVLMALDREETHQYVLVIIAVDDDVNDPLTGTTTVTVDILDENDNPSENGGSLEVSIQAVNGTFPSQLLGSIYFIDADNNTFQNCSILSGDDNLFSIDQTNCTISTQIDNLQPGNYDLKIEGNDGTHHTVNSTVVITVENITTIPPYLTAITLNTSGADYLDNVRITFPSILANSLHVEVEQLQIVSVQKGFYDENNEVDILFSVTDVNGEYLKPIYIIQQLFIVRDQLNIGSVFLHSLPLDACVSEPCSNKARCTTSMSVLGTKNKLTSPTFILFTPLIDISYQCQCVPGSTGEKCEVNIDDCYSNPCLYSASCLDGLQEFFCECPNGTSGIDCSINPTKCQSDSCTNGATCIDEYGSHICQCLPGFYGSQCQYAYFQASSFCDSDPCQNGGTCTQGRDSFTCMCLNGFSGKLCTDLVQYQGGCVDNPCYNGSTCVDTDDGFVCMCSIGFTGPLCRFPLDECELFPCHNGGICETGLYASYRCVCPPPYTGQNCTEIVSPCSLSPCDNGGTCMENSDETFTCECSAEFYGELCEYSVSPPNQCDPNPCTQNGSCSSGQSDFTCTCIDGVSGKDCSIQSTTSPCGSNPCAHAGTCTDLSPLEYTCSCPLGYTGNLCTQDIDECAKEPCLNGGECTDGFGSYLCSCKSGFAGQNCEVICPQGQTGELCKEEFNFCNDTLCHNGGTCVEESTGFSCICSPDYTGTLCDIKLDCQINTCFNGGTCTNSPISFCQCPNGFTGPNCELTTVSFLGSDSVISYRAYDAINFQGDDYLRFDFATRASDGLLLLNTQYQQGSSKDFISIEIISGYVNVGFSFGANPSKLMVLTSSVRVSDGDWHSLQLHIDGKVRVLIVYCVEIFQSIPLQTGSYCYT